MTDNDQAAVEPDGWHDFTLEQAHEFLADMKRQHPGRWTGLGRIAETMTTAVVSEKARADKATTEHDRLTKLLTYTRIELNGVKPPDVASISKRMDAALAEVGKS